MAKGNFIVGEKELNKLAVIANRLNNVPISTELIKHIIHQVIIAQSFVEAFQKFFLSPSENFLTQKQKEEFFQLYLTCAEENAAASILQPKPDRSNQRAKRR